MELNKKHSCTTHFRFEGSNTSNTKDGTHPKYVCVNDPELKLCAFMVNDWLDIRPRPTKRLKPLNLDKGFWKAIKTLFRREEYIQPPTLKFRLTFSLRPFKDSIAFRIDGHHCNMRLNDRAAGIRAVKKYYPTRFARNPSALMEYCVPTPHPSRWTNYSGTDSRMINRDLAMWFHKIFPHETRYTHSGFQCIGEEHAVFYVKATPIIVKKK